MHRSLLPVFFAAAGVLALPQNTGLEALSPCAQAAALQAVGQTQCAITDIACICTGSTFQNALKAAIAAACAPEDVADAEAYGAATCATAGVPIDPNAGSGSTTTPLTPGPSTATPISSDGTGSNTDTDAAAGPATPPAPAAHGNGTIYVNGTCHTCEGGHGNGTAPPPSNPPAPSSPSGPGSSGGPAFTSAGSAVVVQLVMELAVAGVAAAALL